MLLKLLSRKRMMTIIISLSLLVATLLAVIGLHAPFSQPAWSQSPSPFPSPETEAEIDPNHVLVQISLLGFDPIRGEVDTRLGIFPQGTYATEEKLFANDVKLFDVFNVNRQEIKIKAGRPIEFPVSKYTILEGNVNSYPFDVHSTQMAIFMEKVATPASTTPEPPVQPTEGSSEYVVLRYDFFGNLPGFLVQASDNKDAAEDNIFLDLNIRRSLPVIFFSVVVMLIMWALSLIVMCIALSILRSGRMPETGALGFMGALLFAFPAIRNAQPNVPPVGVFSDFLAFFWTETLVVIALLITGICWLRRYNSSPD